MSAEMSINLSQLQEAVEHVQKTQKAQSVRLADGVVAVVRPEKHRTVRRAKRFTPADLTLPTTYTLESAFGSVPIPPHLQGKDVVDIIRAAKEDYADYIMRT